MKRLVSALGSLKLTVALLLLVGGVLAAGTIVESTRGAEAGRADLLRALVLRAAGRCSRSTCSPRSGTAGRATAGGSASRSPTPRCWSSWPARSPPALYKVEGQLPLWEGQQSSAVFVAGGERRDLRAALPGPPRRLRDGLLPGHPPAGDVPQPGHRDRPGGRRAAGGDRDEPAAAPRRLLLLPEQLPDRPRARDVDPLGGARSRPADRLRRLHAAGRSA